jgi:hypothetical protein
MEIINDYWSNLNNNGPESSKVCKLWRIHKMDSGIPDGYQAFVDKLTTLVTTATTIYGKAKEEHGVQIMAVDYQKTAVKHMDQLVKDEIWTKFTFGHIHMYLSTVGTVMNKKPPPKPKKAKNVFA